MAPASRPPEADELDAMADSRTFYEVLAVKPGCGPADIRSAYRRIALQHHPDRSGAPESKEVFIRATYAYEVLSDPKRRAEYDRILALRTDLRESADHQARQQSTASRQAPRPKAPKTAKSPNVAPDLARLVGMFSKGKLLEAERLARQIVDADARHAVPYAVLGDIARSRGEFVRAAELYAQAVQRAPQNVVYLRKHEELVLRQGSSQPGKKVAGDSAALLAPTAGFGMVLLACVYVALHREPPVLPQISLVSTWTLGLLVMLFLSGVAVGAGFSIGRIVDRFDAHAGHSATRLAPAVALLFVAVVNYWAALALFVLTALFQRALDYSASRLLVGVTGTVALMGLAAAASGHLDPVETVLWGGNLAYLGALCGWMVSDSLRDSA